MSSPYFIPLIRILILLNLNLIVNDSEELHLNLGDSHSLSALKLNDCSSDNLSMLSEYFACR